MKGLKIALAVLMLSACAACATTPDEPPVLVEGVRLPAMSDSELSCPVEPPVPQPRVGEDRIRESQLKQYILDLRAAGRVCRERLQVVSRVWRAVEAKQRETSRAIPPRD